MPDPGRTARPRGSLRAGVCAALAAITMHARGAGPERFNDDILFVGMSPGGAIEARALRRSGARVLAIGDGPGPDRIRAEAGGEEYDLSTARGARGFAATLGLPAARAREVADALVAAGYDARDELARVAEVWARVERGGDAPSRLVLSGHSTGSSFWGKDNGALSLDALRALARALPAGAARVEDVQLAGCHTGGPYAMRRLRATFPALRTVWGYAGAAPSARFGATAHAALWERATRGRQAYLDPRVAAGTRRGEAVAVWSVQDGYRAATPAAPLPALRSAVARSATDFQAYLRGEIEVEHSGHEPLRRYYDTVQALLSAPDLPAAERLVYTEHRDQAIRLLYYRALAPRFAAAHAAAIREGYAAVALPAPELAVLPRRAALAQIAALGERVRGAAPAPPAAAALLTLLEEGLRDLRATRIPDSWL